MEKRFLRVYPFCVAVAACAVAVFLLLVTPENVLSACNLSIIIFIYYNKTVLNCPIEEDRFPAGPFFVVWKMMRLKIKKIFARPALLTAAAVFAFSFAFVPGASAAAGEINVSEKIKQLKETNAAKRIEAVLELGKTGDPRAKKALSAEFKKEKNPFVKSKMVEALGRHGGDAALAELAAIARSEPDTDSRSAAVRALGELKNEAAVPVLLEKFLDEKEKIGIRLQAANALTNYPKEEVFAVFVIALEDKNPVIKKQALVSLYNGFAYDGKKVLPYIEKMVKDKDTEAIAQQYLKNLGAGR